MLYIISKINLSKEELEKLYWEDNLSMHKIAKIYGVCYNAISKKMKKYRISRRTLSESKRKIKRLPFSDAWKKNISESKKGHMAWNKGLTKEIDERIRKMSDSLNGEKNPMKGCHHSEETKKKMKESHKGKMHSEETINKIRKSSLRQVFPIKDTLPERMLQDRLKSVSIELVTHKAILGQPDIFIEPNICVFVDGCYWHGCLECFPDRNKLDNIQRHGIVRDMIVTQGLINEGYVVVRFWEHEIHDDIDLCISQIKNMVIKR